MNIPNCSIFNMRQKMGKNIIIVLLSLIIMIFGYTIIIQKTQINNIAYVATQTADRVIIYSKYIYLQEKIIKSYNGEFFTDYDVDKIDFFVYSELGEKK